MNPTVVLSGGSADGQRFELLDTISIGREGTDIVLNDARVSRRHATITATTSGIYLTDLGSTNGTFVNGERIMGEVALNPGEMITIGETTLYVERPVTATIVGTTPPSSGGTVVGASPSAAVVDAPSPAPPPASPPPAPAPAVAVAPSKPVPPPTFDAAAPQRSGLGGIPTRRYLPTALTIGTIAATALALIVYFAVR